VSSSHISPIRISNHLSFVASLLVAPCRSLQSRSKKALKKASGSTTDNTKVKKLTDLINSSPLVNTTQSNLRAYASSEGTPDRPPVLMGSPSSGSKLWAQNARIRHMLSETDDDMSVDSSPDSDPPPRKSEKLRRSSAKPSSGKPSNKSKSSSHRSPPIASAGGAQQTTSTVNLTGLCYFSTKPIPIFSRHYTCVSNKGKTFFIHPSALGFSSCPVISVPEFKKACQTFPREWNEVRLNKERNNELPTLVVIILVPHPPNPFRDSLRSSQLPNECKDGNSWVRVSKFCSFSKLPIPDGVPFYYTPNHIKSNNNPYYLISSVLGFRQVDEVPRNLDRGHCSLVNKTFSTSKHLGMLKDSNQWRVVDKFCYFTSGPINGIVDIHFLCELQDDEAGALPAQRRKTLYMIPPQNNVGNFDTFFKNDIIVTNQLAGFAFASLEELEVHEKTLHLKPGDFAALRELNERRFGRLPVTVIDPSRWKMVVPPSYLRARSVAIQRVRQANHMVTLSQREKANVGVYETSPNNSGVEIMEVKEKESRRVVPISCEGRKKEKVTTTGKKEGVGSAKKKSMLMKAAGRRAMLAKKKAEEEEKKKEMEKRMEIKADAMERKGSPEKGGKTTVEKKEEVGKEVEAVEDNARGVNVAEVRIMHVLSQTRSSETEPPKTVEDGAQNSGVTKPTKPKSRIQARMAARSAVLAKKKKEKTAVQPQQQPAAKSYKLNSSKAKSRIQARIAARSAGGILSKGTGSTGETKSYTTVSDEGGGDGGDDVVGGVVGDGGGDLGGDVVGGVVGDGTGDGEGDVEDDPHFWPIVNVPSRKTLLNEERHRDEWEKLQMRNIEMDPDEGRRRAELGNEVKDIMGGAE